MSWDTETIPYLGIWVDHGLASREPVVAIEPTTGYYDSLERADRDGRVAVVSPDRPLRFTLMVEVRGGAAHRALWRTGLPRRPDGFSMDPCVVLVDFVAPGPPVDSPG